MRLIGTDTGGIVAAESSLTVTAKDGYVLIFVGATERAHGLEPDEAERLARCILDAAAWVRRQR